MNLCTFQISQARVLLHLVTNQTVHFPPTSAQLITIVTKIWNAVIGYVDVFALNRSLKVKLTQKYLELKIFLLKSNLSFV